MGTLAFGNPERGTVFQRLILHKEQNTDVLEQTDRKNVGRQIRRKFRSDRCGSHPVTDGALPESGVIERAARFRGEVRNEVKAEARLHIFL